MRKAIFRIGIFLVILMLLLFRWNSVFKMKDGDGIYDLTKFYELEDNTVDVLILGSSHAFEDFNTGTLWDEFGTSSFVLGGSSQPMWNTYYYLKEALKTQSPKVIVLEGYMTTYVYDYIDNSRIIKNNYGLHWSKDKIESLKISAPEKQWREFFFEYVQYHTRYKDIDQKDYLKNQGNPLFINWKGFGCNMDTTPFTVNDVSGIKEDSPMTKKTEKYYRMILELAKDNNIPIIVVITPYADISDSDQRVFNGAEIIAKEYEIPFINCNLLNQEIGIDYSTDAADIAHLNYRGNQKLSQYIGQYLSDHYEIPDHRDDARYLSWQADADYIRRMVYNQELTETVLAERIVQKIKDPDYWVFVSVDGKVHTTSDETIKSLLNGIGIQTEEANRVWYVKDGLSVWDTSKAPGELYLSTETHDFHLIRAQDKDGAYYNTIVVDNVQYSKVNNGVNIVVYDTVTEKIVDCIGFDADEGYAVIR